MADMNFAFEVDAGKIMAKLHLAGCQTHADCMFFNGGIIEN